MAWSASRVAIISGILACFGVGIGIIIGYFGINTNSSDSATPSPSEDVAAVRKLINEISAERIKKNLR